MGIFEIISAIVLIIACVFIVIVVLMNDTKSGMSQAISGASSDSFYQKNSGRTKEAKLNRAMVVATVVFFVLAFEKSLTLRSMIFPSSRFIVITSWFTS